MKTFERIRAAKVRFVDTVFLPLVGAFCGIAIGVLAQKYAGTPNPFRNEAIGEASAGIAACALTAYIISSYLDRKSPLQKSSAILLSNHIKRGNYENK